ncbi:hypothetical protein U1Q18_020364 [Sarracenia purpurea var. burkii]
MRTVKKLKHGGAVGVHQSPEVVFGGVTGDFGGRRKASKRITEHRGGEAAGVASRRRQETGGRSDAHRSLESKRARSTGVENCSVIGAKKTNCGNHEVICLDSGQYFGATRAKWKLVQQRKSRH